MSMLTADDKRLLKDLGMYLEPVEVYDSAGKLLGLFVPANLEKAKQLSATARARIDAEKIRLRQQSLEKGCTTKEVFEHLKSITNDENMRNYLQKKIDVLAERDRCDTP